MSVEAFLFFMPWDLILCLFVLPFLLSSTCSHYGQSHHYCFLWLFFFSKKTKREKNPAIAKHINLESKLCHCIEGLHFYLKNNIPQYLNSISLDIICWDLLYPKILITSNILGTKNSDFCLISRNTFLYHFQRIE